MSDLEIIRQEVSQSRRVLIVEDEAPLADVIQRALHRAGFEAEIALDGRMAAGLIKEFQPAIITLDLQMPNLNGMDFLRILRSNSRFRKTKILVVSAMAGSVLQESLAMGADAALAKPFRTAALIEKIVELTESFEKAA